MPDITPQPLPELVSPLNDPSLNDLRDKLQRLGFTVEGKRLVSWTPNGSLGADALAGLFVDAINSLIRVGTSSGNSITIDGANERIRSSNYSAGVSGFTVEPDLVEAQNIRARGVLQSAVFQKDIISAIGGVLLVANSDALGADMTAADNSTLTIKGDTTFAVNDIIRIKDATDEEWLRVTNVASAPTYTVTRDLGAAYSANSNPAWKNGQAVVKQGTSDGASSYGGGWLQLFGEGTNSPYYSVFKRTGVTYNAYTEVIRIGNLNGFLDYVSDEFGIGMGTASDYIAIDATNGVRLSAPVNVDISFTAGEALTVGNAVGLYGEITNTNHALETAAQATMVDEGNATTNYDGTNPITVENLASNKYGLMSWASLPDVATVVGAITGATLLSIEVRFKMSWVDGLSSGQVRWSYNAASFTEGTVTWNTKPSSTEGADPVVFDNTDADSYFTTGWLAVTTTEYAGIRSNGITLKVNGASSRFFVQDENQAEPPQIQVRYTYKVRDGQIYKVKATTSEYANSFMGIAQATVIAAATVKVRTEGKDVNQSGLTSYATQYLSDTDGAVSDSPGSSSKVVGRALSATALQIKYVLT